MSDLSKLCADFLRTTYTAQTGGKLKATHARELVAAFFGYKSHAALISEKDYPVDNLEEATILIPDIPLIEQRRTRLNELPDDLMPSNELASAIASFIDKERYLGGDAWLYETLESYVTDVLLPESDALVSDQLGGVMAETNAEFTDFPYYEDAVINDVGDALEVRATGQLQGTPLEKPFCGDTIDMSVLVTFPRVAGKRGFLDFDIEVGGSVNDDWVDPELKSGAPAKSPLAEELGITDQELGLLEWEEQEIASNDGHPYGHVLTFNESNPPEILQKIEGLTDGRTIRVSVNAFDEPTYYDVPNIRPKDQWLEMTGGFKHGESKEQFKSRQTKIHMIRNRIEKETAIPKDFEELARLLGIDEDDPLADF